MQKASGQSTASSTTQIYSLKNWHTHAECPYNVIHKYCLYLRRMRQYGKDYISSCDNNIIILVGIWCDPQFQHNTISRALPTFVSWQTISLFLVISEIGRISDLNNHDQLSINLALALDITKWLPFIIERYHKMSLVAAFDATANDKQWYILLSISLLAW